MSGSLSALLEPKGICVVGASPDGGYGRRVVESLVQGGYGGPVVPVHPRAESVAGLPAVKRIAEIGDEVSLAIVAVSVAKVAAVLGECADAGIAAAIVFSSGFAETDGGQAYDREVRSVVEGSGLRLLGPNCLGVVNWAHDLNATPRPLERPLSGSLGLISQSGALAVTTVIPRASQWGVGFTKVVSTGNEVDVGLAECVESFLDDGDVSTVCAIVESFREPAAFRSAARRASLLAKRVVLLKIGRSRAGARAARSHTGAIVGRWEAERAALEADGVVVVDSPDALWRVAASLDGRPRTQGRRVFVLSTSGGLNGLVADALSAAGADIVALPDRDKAQFAKLLPHYASVDNPLDLTGGVVGADDEPSVFSAAAQIGAEVTAADAVVVGVTVPRPSLVDALVDVRDRLGKAEPPVQLLPVYVGHRSADEQGGERVLQAAGLVAADTVETLVSHWAGIVADARSGRAFAALPSLSFRHGPLSFGHGPGSFGYRQGPSPGGSDAEALWADPWRASERLRTMGLPLAPGVEVASEEEIAGAAATVGLPAVAKSLAPGLFHKSDVGGVLLGNVSEADVRAAYRRVAEATGCPRVLLQHEAPPGLDLLVSVRREGGLGMTMVVGLGGVAVEVLDTYVVIAEPFTSERVRLAVEEAGWAPLVRAFRGRGPLDVDALVAACLVLGGCLSGAPDLLHEIECNPLRLYGHGAGCEVLDVKCYVDDGPAGGPCGRGARATAPRTKGEER